MLDPVSFSLPVTVAAAPVPTLAVAVTGASEEGIAFDASIENIVLRDAADVPDTGKADQGVYVALVETDRVGELANGAEAAVVADFAYKMFIVDGKVTRSILAPAAELDRSKGYTVVAWLAHGNLNDDRFLAQAELLVSEVQWDAVFPPAPVDTPEVTIDGLEDGVIEQGKSLTFGGGPFVPGTQVVVTVNSEPVDLGTHEAGANGRVSVEWTVPASFAVGQHTVNFAVVGGETHSQSFTVVPAAVTEPGGQTPVDPAAPGGQGGRVWWWIEQFCDRPDCPHRCE